MPKSICKFNFSDIESAFSRFDSAVRTQMAKVGKVAVDYAVQNGDYRDVSGRLRKSNRAEVVGRNLRIYNEAEYAADVEARGQDVIGNAALYAEQRLKEIFE